MRTGFFERHLYLDEDVPEEMEQRRQRSDCRRKTLQEAQMNLTFPGARTATHLKDRGRWSL